MKRVKSYKNFNEEINWKKAVAGAALGAGVALGNPSDAISQKTTDSTLQARIDMEVGDVLNFGTLSVDSISGYYPNLEGVYVKSDNIFNSVESSWFDYKSKRYFIIYIVSSHGVASNTKTMFIMTEGVYDTLINNLGNYNENILLDVYITIGNPNNSHGKNSLMKTCDKIEEDQLEKLKLGPKKYNSRPKRVVLFRDTILLKIGYLDGKKIVRFKIPMLPIAYPLTTHKEVDNLNEIEKFNKVYHECPFVEFVKLIQR